MPESAASFHGRPRLPSSHGKRLRGRALQDRRRRVFERDGWRCCRCGCYGTRDTLKADHYIPLADGGRDTLANMQTLCGGCHDAKTAAEREGRAGR